MSFRSSAAREARETQENSIFKQVDILYFKVLKKVSSFL